MNIEGKESKSMLRRWIVLLRQRARFQKKYSRIAPSSSFQSSTSGNYTKGKQAVSKYGTDGSLHSI